jgi:Domain of unknown function (DUF4913)
MTDDELSSRLQAAQQRAEASTGLLRDQTERGSGPAAGADSAAPYCSSLEDWVATVFCPTFVRRSTPTFRWCSQWWRHSEAISRLEALWRTWEALRLDPLFGMATWYRDHLDHQLAALTAAAGPFADCDPLRHFPPESERLPHTPAPAGWWPEVPHDVDRPAGPADPSVQET